MAQVCKAERPSLRVILATISDRLNRKAFEYLGDTEMAYSDQELWETVNEALKALRQVQAQLETKMQAANPDPNRQMTYAEFQALQAEQELAAKANAVPPTSEVTKGAADMQEASGNRKANDK